jgi:DNA-binding transcriptional regulator YdaS (Cro superfamily)
MQFVARIGPSYRGAFEQDNKCFIIFDSTEREIKMDEVIKEVKENRFKKHFKDHKEFYLGVWTGISTVATVLFTIAIMKEESNIGSTVKGTGKNSISNEDELELLRKRNYPALAECGTEKSLSSTFSGHDNTYGNVYLTQMVKSHRKGAPSHIVQDEDTGEVYRSQRKAAMKLGVSESSVSKHLRGETSNAEGHHLKRIAVAA